MNKPLLLADFVVMPPAYRAAVVDGLPAAIDLVAEAAAESHRFLRHGWFAAAIEAYGGRVRTVLAREGEVPVLAVPFVPVGPAALGLAGVPGCYWPYRSVPIAAGAGQEAARAALAVLAQAVRGLRIGPVPDGDPGADALVSAARAAGWAAIERPVAQSWLLDMAALRAEGAWPRGSTLRKNRFHEKHLAAHGVLEWRFVERWDDGAFDALASVERASWIADRTNGSDAKFTDKGHGRFWRAAARDPVVAGMMRAAVLRVNGRPAAFSFNLDTGSLRHAIANSYDPLFARHSPGKLLQYRDMADAIARGVERVDWGAGDSGYKQVIGAEAGPVMRDWLLLRPGAAAVAGKVMARWWRRSGGG